MDGSVGPPLPTSGGDGGAGQQEEPRDAKGQLIELVAVVAVAVGLALLIQSLLVKPYRIPSESMKPTLEIGQRVLVNRVAGRFGTPQRGDVAVFRPPAGAGDPECGVEDGQEYLPGKVYIDAPDSAPMRRMPCPVGTGGEYEETYIKRIVGVPGDRIKIIRGQVWVNEKPADELGVIGRDAGCLRAPEDADDCTYGLEITVPPDSYYMLGDNRNPGGSEDSRYWGAVPRANIIGKAFVTYWPVDRIGGL